MRTQSLTLAAISLLLTSHVAAQNNGSISGTVLDSSGAVLPSAAVKLKSHEQGIVRSAQTNTSGVYQFSFLPPGTYDLEVSANGFKTTTRANETLAVAEDRRINLSMEIGNVAENVTVNAAEQALNTDNANLGAVLDNTKVVEMPLNGRVFWNLAELTPGVAPPAQGSSNGYRGGFNVLGAGEEFNNFSVNGFDNNNNTTNVPNFRPSIDAIQEFNIITGIYPAQYGFGSGGQIIVTTKSGTNEYHGSGYDFLRNQVMDSRNFFSPPGPIASFKRNQFGGTFGGPIKKDKTFFFYSYEGLRTVTGDAQLLTIPTVAMDSGNFSGIPTVIKDPTTGAPFAGNIIPANRLNAVGVALMRAYPAPTFATPAGQSPNNNYDWAGGTVEHYNEDSLKLDHVFSAKDSAYITANWYRDVSEDQGNGTSCSSVALPGFSCHNELRSQIYGIAETHVFSPTMVNEARIGVDLIWLPEFTNTDGLGFFGSNSPFGINALIAPVLRIPSSGYPTLNVTGYASLPATSFYYHQPNWQWTDTFSWTLGKHTIKTGFNVLHSASNTENIGSPQGTVTFTNSSSGPTSGYAMADLALGLPATTSSNPYNYEWYPRGVNIASFIQDDYKISPSLTLNFGLRWDVDPPVTLNDHHLTSFNPTLGIPVTQANPAPFAPGGAIVVGFKGNNVYNTDWKDFGPRLGFAWQPFHDTKTVVRGGAGTFYDNISLFRDGQSSLWSGYPYSVSNTNTSSLTQPISLSNPYPTTGIVAKTTLAGITPTTELPRSYEWSLGVQRELAKDLLLEVTYFGSAGNHLGLSQNINQPAPGPGTPAQVNARRPYPAWGTISWWEWTGISSYESGQINLRKRYGYGLSFLFSYSYAHSIDDYASDGAAPVTNSYNFLTARGSSNFDTRHRIVWSPVYELPFGKGKPFASQGLPAQIIGGWQLSGLFQFQTGSPLTATMSGNFSNSGGQTDRPDVIGNPNSNAPNTPQEWFNTAAFIATRAAANQPGATYSFGNEGRNVIIGPGLVNVDLSIVRNFLIRERIRIQFRGELFDALNHPNFGNPNVIANTPQFGTITATNTNGAGNRTIQVALKLNF
jgi:hypothetical protein